MRIAIDARKLHDFGIGTYVQNLLRQLARLDADSEYVLFCRKQDRDALDALGPNFRTSVDSASPYSIREQASIPSHLLRERVDVYHSPHYVLPPLVPCRSVVTIHDCIHLMFPQYLPNRLAYAYAKMFMWWAAHRSARVLTVSEASKRDILHYFAIPDEKVIVIHNGLDERFRVPPPDTEIHRVRERFQLNEQFILYAGNVKPHKNVERLIDAFHILHTNGFEHLKLLIIGSDISKYATLRRAIHTHDLHKYVRFLGFVSDETLAALYRLSAVFVFPSLYEGFGFPPLEAMASGTPVVASNLSSLPEVLGDAALLVDPYDANALADAIRRVLLDDALRRDLSARGLAKVQEYSWEQAARRVRRIYEEVATEARQGRQGTRGTQGDDGTQARQAGPHKQKGAA
jgi:glycosyltransferase involved in cell wall biosynthesis